MARRGDRAACLFFAVVKVISCLSKKGWRRRAEVRCAKQFLLTAKYVLTMSTFPCGSRKSSGVTKTRKGFEGNLRLRGVSELAYGGRGKYDFYFSLR